MATQSTSTPRRGRPRKDASATPASPADDAALLASVLAGFDELPDIAHVRLPVVRALYGFCSASTIWRGVRNGTVPEPVTLGERMTAWRVGDLRAALNTRGAA